MTVGPDCVLTVAGVRFADTAAALLAGSPTVLADVEVVWGRDTTVDQPAAATCTALIEDRSGGPDFLTSVLDVGASFEVTATGDIATVTPPNVVHDPGFETLPSGTIIDRVAVQTGTATVTGNPVHGGAQAVTYDPAQAAWLLIPPAAFSTNPAAWDDLPRFDPDLAWTWQLAVRPDRLQTVTVTPVALSGPTSRLPGASAGLAVTVTGDGTWHVVAGATTPTAGPPAGWVGLRVDVGARPPWTAVAGPWTAAPGTWLDYRGVTVDDVELAEPAGAPELRPALVFSGQVSDLNATMDGDGTLRVQVTAVDQLAQLMNRAVGDVPWPAETLAARVAHVLTAAGVAPETRIDSPLDTATVSWVDVDNQPAGALIAGYAQGVDGVLWSATHATTGPYLWIENPTGRAQLGELVLDGALVVIVWNDDLRGSTQLDGCLVPVEPIVWVRDVSDVITRVDATWSEQTLDDAGLPSPTDRTVTVNGDPAAVTKHGVRRYAVTTNLISAAAAQEVATRILNRSTTLQWRATGLSLDLAVMPPADGDDVADVLDLLDGTTRLGRGIVVDDAALWPGDPTVGLYLEGGVYRFDGAWRLALNCSAHTGMGASVLWNELDPAWAWLEFDPAIRWFDLYGVAA